MRIDTVTLECREQSGTNPGQVAGAPEFHGAAAARSGWVIHAPRHGGLIWHPVQGGAGEHAVEAARPLGFMLEALSVQDPGLDAAGAGRLNLLRARIDTDDMTTGSSDAVGQRAVAAIAVSNAFPRRWGQEIEQRSVESPSLDADERHPARQDMSQTLDQLEQVVGTVDLGDFTGL